MTSFRISVSPNRRAAARFVGKVRRRIQKAYAERPDISQSDIAGKLGVHRSVINRQLRGNQDMTIGRVAELAWALGLEPEFDLIAPPTAPGSNMHPQGSKYESGTCAAADFEGHIIDKRVETVHA